MTSLVPSGAAAGGSTSSTGATDPGGSVELQAVADRLEIQEQLARYARGVDTKDWELWRSVFTEDAVVDYSQSGVMRGSRDEVAAFLSEAFASIPWATHHITNVEIDRSEEHTSELQSLMRTSYDVFCLKKK